MKKQYCTRHYSNIYIRDVHGICLAYQSTCLRNGDIEVQETTRKGCRMLSTDVRKAPLCTSCNVAVGRGSHIAMSPSTAYLMFHEHLFCGADWKCGFCSRCIWRQCWNIRIQDYNITETGNSPCLGSQNVVKTSGALQLTRKWYSTTARSVECCNLFHCIVYRDYKNTALRNTGHILWT